MSLCKVITNSFLSEISHGKGCNKIKCIVVTGSISSLLQHVGQMIGELKTVKYEHPITIIKELLDNNGQLPRYGCKVLTPELEALHRLGFIIYNESYIQLDDIFYQLCLHLDKTSQINKLNMSLNLSKAQLLKLSES